MATASKASRMLFQHEIDDDSTASESQSTSRDPTPAVGPRKRRRSCEDDKELKPDDPFADEPHDLTADLRTKKGRLKKPRVTRRKPTAKRKPRDSLEDTGIKINEGLDKAEEEPKGDLVPERILSRRQHFHEAYKALGDSGLKVPPNYDDIYFSDDERMEELAERPKFDAKFDHVKPCRPYKDVSLEASAGLIPASIAQYLRDYQVEGVAFLHEKFVYQKGAILGDDMGLGKTVQVAAFLAAAFGKTGDERDAKRMRKMHQTDRWYPRVLIVCPSTLIPNWRSELERWGWWKVEIYHGPSKEEALRSAQSGNLEIMLTTYGTYMRYDTNINMIDWDAVVADECHQLKDRKRTVTKTMEKVNALCRIGLTGTAIQNDYFEYWTLLNWTNPGDLGTRQEWKESIVEPLSRGQSHDATLQQLSLARKTAKKLVEHLLPRYFLRRMKTLIAHQLPKKTDRVVFCPLTKLQKDAYEKLLASEEVQTILRSTKDCECGSGTKRGWCCGKLLPDGKPWTAYVFPAMLALKKLSNHLALLLPAEGEADEEKKERAMKCLRTALPDHWKGLHKLRGNIETLSNPEFCGKWKILKELLSHWYTNQDKVLVFSHSVRLLKFFASLFKQTHYTVSFLSGEMDVEDRQKEVDDFNSDPGKFVFLISTKAGSVGLNITSANKVVIIDPHWNPSHDLQAQDRAYRIGQRRDVEVYRLVSVGTIEEIVYARQIYKQQQANIGYTASIERRYFKGVQKDPGRKGELFGLHNLFTFHGDQVVLQGIMNQTNIAEARVSAQMVDIDMEKATDEDDLAKIKTEPADDDDNGLSQLAAYVQAENPEQLTKKSKAPLNKSMHVIQAILASAGVQYSHENSEVIGSSKIEEQLSRRAVLNQDTDWGDQQDQSALFAEEQANEAFVDEDDLTGRGFTPRFKPPQDVMRRQFCSMAKDFGYDNVVEFALVVEQMTQKERRDALDLFYQKRMKLLSGGVKKEETGAAKEPSSFNSEAGRPARDSIGGREDAASPQVRAETPAEAMDVDHVESRNLPQERVTRSQSAQSEGRSNTTVPEFINGVRSLASIAVYSDDEEEL